ncbi:LOW QUALITY PROTEIN: transmembrane protease serine 2-like [Cynoglossus semilaevis]|uniref:LOW QUALITY PROTEIN: transmembrane protease serine 2-like n=1 Tax=Cynoglossus semilaevis TaxID=244447 RepID=UPI000D626487|nr:LOW QUALITY PROTEIN: transmembrane protease serine 2-like [Cynoglossus semilaevis]
MMVFTGPEKQLKLKQQFFQTWKNQWKRRINCSDIFICLLWLPLQDGHSKTKRCRWSVGCEQAGKHSRRVRCEEERHFSPGAGRNCSELSTGGFYCTHLSGKMKTNLILDTGRCFIHEDRDWRGSAPPRADVMPQYVHHLASKPPPEVSPPTTKRKDFKHRCVKFTVTAVVCLLLLLLVTGILLAYYYSSPCAHGRQCGDGSCVWESEWCDGVRDCPAGQDEANCGKNTDYLCVCVCVQTMQMYSSQTDSWSSVCSQDWTQQQSRSSCRSLGYSRDTYYKSGEQTSDSDEGFLKVKSGLNPDSFILQQLVHSKVCPNNSVVTLQCTDCGRGVNSSRSLGAQPASPGSWPWHVSLQRSGSHRCGGALISPYWILTAAHCVVRASDPAAWAVYTGVVDPLGSLFNPARSVSHVIAHQDYNHLTRTNDVALMRLSKAVDSTGSSQVRPVCLPAAGLNFAAPQTGWITRYVLTTAGDFSSAHLTETQVSLIDISKCNSSTAYGGKLSQDMLCTRETEAGTNKCHVDSGGPLVSLTDGLWWLVGDSIWGENCVQTNKPGVFGNVTFFLEWIQDQMKKHQDD